MLAIIPARGGSKGLPRKNIKPLLGKPLIYYTIKTALKSENISKLIVSTDNKEIASIASSYGAECPFMRPAELSTDKALSINVYRYVLNQLEKKFNYNYLDFIVLQPTSPLRKTIDIDNAIKIFKEKNADSVISFCKAPRPLVWHKRIKKDGKVESIFKDRLNNRQDEEQTYFPNGAIYIFKRKIISQSIFYTKKTYAYLMDNRSSIDIDTQEDFDYAEFIMSKTDNA